MEKYLDILEKQIGKSDRLDDKICTLLECEVNRCNIIMIESAETYNTGIYNTDISKARLDNTYEFETAYKNRALTLIDKILNNEPN